MDIVFLHDLYSVLESHEDYFMQELKVNSFHGPLDLVSKEDNL